MEVGKTYSENERQPMDNKDYRVATQTGQDEKRKAEAKMERRPCGVQRNDMDYKDA